MFGLPKRLYLLKKMDWGTIFFFIGMFILMKSIWNTNLIQNFLKSHNIDVTSTPILISSSIILSQILSNVPLVALFMPILKAQNVGTFQYMALAAASTLAGNFLVLGAASNIIVVQNAEKLGEKVPSIKFSLIGITLGIVNVVIIYFWFLFLRLIGLNL